MSRSRKDGRQGGGHRIRGRDFQSKRCRDGWTQGTGRYAKKLTLGKERAEQRVMLKQAKEEVTA